METTLQFFLAMVLGALLFSFGPAVYVVGKNTVLYIKFLFKNSKRKKELDSQQCKGGHIWDHVSTENSRVRYCTVCKYAPELNNYVSMENVVYFKKLEEDRVNYENFKNNRMKVLAEKHELSSEQLLEIMSSLRLIPSEYMKSVMEGEEGNIDYSKSNGRLQ